MATTRGSSRRRLAFTTPPVSQSTACSVCKQVHTSLSSPDSWKDEGCRQLAISLDISGHNLVCRPCRNDMARLMKNPSHCPRWEKDKISGCAIPQCKDPFFSKCNIPNSDIVQCLTIAGENIPSKLDIAPPLCKHHYHVVYNVHKPTQTHCLACSTGLQKGSRPCPDAASITMYLADKTGTIGENDSVLFMLQVTLTYTEAHSK